MGIEWHAFDWRRGKARGEERPRGGNGHRATGEGDRPRVASRSQCFLRAKTTVSDRGLLSP